MKKAKKKQEKVQRNILVIVDDVAMNRALLGQMFQKEFEILEAENGEEAIQIINEYYNNIALVLLDIKMPVMDGFEVMSRMKFYGYMKQIPVILITSDEEGNAMEKGYALGATDVVFKPFQAHVVIQRVHNIYELYQHKNHLEDLVEEQTAQLEEQYELLKEHHRHLVSVLRDIVEYRNVEYPEHLDYIQGYTRILAENYAMLYPRAKMTKEKIGYIVQAARFHDVGKITMPDAILSRPGRLSKWDLELLKEHTIKGRDIVQVMAELEDDMFSKICCNVCLYHHAKYDGSGYPVDIRKERIPIEAQIVGLADMYETMVHSVALRKKYSKEQVYNMLMNGKCGELSPRMKECLQASKKELEAYSLI